MSAVDLTCYTKHLYANEINHQIADQYITNCATTKKSNIQQPQVLRIMENTDLSLPITMVQN